MNLGFRLILMERRSCNCLNCDNIKNKISTAISRGHNSIFLNQKKCHKLIINHVNSNKDRKGIQGFPNRCYTYESNQPNLALGMTIKTLNRFHLFYSIYF